MLLELFMVVAAIQASGAESKETALQMVVHVNFADVESQKRGLHNVANVLKAVPKAEVVVVCHGPGIGLVVRNQSKHTEEVAGLVAKGVRFCACENTMREKGIVKAQLLPDIRTVPSGAVEVVRRQQAGFGYFKP